MTADQNQTAATEAADTTPPAADPKPGYRKIEIPAHTIEVKTEPDPLVDRIFGYVGSEAKRFDEFSVELYAAVAQHIADMKRADGTFADPYSTEPAIDTEAAFKAQQTIDAYYSALSNLRNAAEHLRAVKLALSPYADPKLLTRGY